jgi:response regulator RpfG family c-di-GMP phosphodiesterase
MIRAASQISMLAARAATDERVHVLLVDDEPKVLEGLSLHLRFFRLSLATSGQAGLRVLDQPDPPAVIISDMRMPEMDGAAFLSRARERLPDAVRVLLTGHTDLDGAVAAVNHGQIFRFLTKPCPPPLLVATVKAAAEQHRLVTAEKVLLEQTLRGSIKALIDMLALAHPLAFGRALRIKQQAMALARATGGESWEIEVAAMLSQVGCAVLPPALLEKLSQGESLSADEEHQLERVPEVAERLLESIPRLETVRAILREQGRRFDGEGTPPGAPRGESIPRGARILRAVVDFDALETAGLSPTLALERMSERAGLYDPVVLHELGLISASDAGIVRELPLRSLAPGMVVARNIVSRAGHLLVSRGQEVTSGVLQRLRNVPVGMVKEPVQVLIPEDVSER